ncbi:CTP synthase [Mesomycoplasma lagogenitalium]|uniref:CTP synthase (glutamine hydrolyzing) n=1 Tax=Mesomycoplasma lagogenitalium TaxID=171286 RepID=A0ABY8LVN6_9BACT|nr:CTP synthase [Mesomycoplasma lagogenitalium]WGI36348.1 CTP synthase [Mesomycoplasma lagogenitalium]
MSKFIFVTGGVISGLGKGVAAASIGNLLKARGYSVFVLKLDPYLNLDPGVMSPYEHGEVYVTADGGETDLDLGHYERFINENFSKDSNYTSGKIFSNILEKERKGLYYGKTVQFIPHVTDEIISIIKNIEQKYQSDFVIVEIGGTVGDIESNPFIYAIAQMGSEFNGQNTFFVHVTYVPFLETSKDFKTKPTQDSVNKLKGMGIKPNMILLRANHFLPDSILIKVANATFINKENVISAPDLENVYQMPLYLENENTASIILNYFKMKKRKPKLNKWIKFVNKVEKDKKKTLNIKMLGKYTAFSDAYKSINEALKISAIDLNYHIKLDYIDAELLNENNIKQMLNGAHGVVILPGFGARGFEGKVLGALYTREKNIPTLGICLGMQAMTVAQARLKGIKNATSKEFANKNKQETYILDLIKGKKADDQIGGTLRLGESETVFKKDSLIAKYYQTTNVFERHRHRYEVQEKYIPILEDEDFSFSGYHPELKLVESCEDKSKDFYIGVQYHPEFTARPLAPHKLFNAFIKKSANKK